MIDRTYFRLVVFAVILSSILFGMLRYFLIQYQFYVWEIFIDAKILCLLGLIFFLYKKKTMLFTKDQFVFLQFDWRKNLVVCSLPLFFYVIPIIVGLLIKEVSVSKLDNATTLVLATLFDLPAIYFFSLTSIFIEEIFFRGILLSTFQQKYSPIHSIILSSLFWMMFNISELVGLEELNFAHIIVIAIYFFSIGILCAAFSNKYKSVWLGYSFRVGIIALIPIILTSSLLESDSFLTTTSYFFNAEGIVVSLLLIVSGVILYTTTAIAPAVNQAISIK